MKRIVTLLLAALLLMLAVAPACAAILERTMYVNTPNGKVVNVRYGPGKDYDAWAHAKNGTKVTVVKVSGAWSLCRVPGLKNEGWIMSKFLSTKKPVISKTPTASYDSFVSVNPYNAVLMYPKSNYLNLRWAPSTSAKVIRRVFNGSVLKVMAVSKDWAQVYDSQTGLTGFMSINYLVPVIQTPAA